MYRQLPATHPPPEHQTASASPPLRQPGLLGGGLLGGVLLALVPPGLAVLGAVQALFMPAGSAHAQSTTATNTTANSASRLADKPAAAPPAARPAEANSAGRGLDCMIQPSQMVQVGSPVAGVIEQILVDRGDSVKRGQALVQLNASVERAALHLAQERAAQHGELMASEGANTLAERELERADELHRKNFVSGTYLDKQRAEARVAGGRRDEARERRKLAARELALATAQLEQRTLRSPVNGVVVERSMALGEFIDQRPVLRIADINPLRVDVLVPAAAFGRVQIGATGRVVPELLDRRTITATVKTVDRVIDAASNTFRVRLELPNPGNTLPAGLRCKVDLDLSARPTSPAPAQVATGALPAATATTAQNRR